MPWPKEHKHATRERIVKAAAAAFRERGVGEVGVAEVMRRADLTHGGFYAHFASKDELVAETLPHAMERLRGGASQDLLVTAEAYLSAPHMDHPEVGCAIAALGTELVRGSRRVRQSLAREIRKRLHELRALVPSASRERRDRQTAGALACMVGGLILARGLKGPVQAKFLADCRAFLRDALSATEKGN
jgi:TetR/AcrR family transcriptional repressor of nem operon